MALTRDPTPLDQIKLKIFITFLKKMMKPFIHFLILQKLKKLQDL